MERNISVIIIARNEPLIRYTLESLAYQELKPYEVIVVVDSPDDISAEIAQEYMSKLPIKIVINDIKPGYGARKKGVEVARDL
jgi:glycosyltransferase involved in cell wall biosynthesis